MTDLQIFVMKAKLNCQKVYSFLLLLRFWGFVPSRFCSLSYSVQFIWHNISWENVLICKNFILSSFCFKLSMCMRFLRSGSLHSASLNSAEYTSHKLYVLHQLSCLLLCAKFLFLPPLTRDVFSKHYYFSQIHFLTKALLVYCILAYQWCQA